VPAPAISQTARRYPAGLLHAVGSIRGCGVEIDLESGELPIRNFATCASRLTNARPVSRTVPRRNKGLHTCPTFGLLHAINEHRMQRVCCPACGSTVRAELPASVPRGCSGPKLEGAIASLTVGNRLSRRQLLELMDELYGCPIAVGTIGAILTRTAETLAPVYDELLEQTRAAGALNVDETGWYLSGEPRALWGAFSNRTAVLRIAPDRGKQHLHGLIGDEFAGIVCDRFSAYNSLEPERRQVCWSHLRRDFTFHADLGLGSQKAFGLDGLEVTWNVFQAWKQFQRDGDRDGTSSSHRSDQDADCGRCWSGARPANSSSTSRRSRRPPLRSVRRGRQRRADQQRRRARPACRRHLPQALPWQPFPRAASARLSDCSRSIRLAGYSAARSTPMAVLYMMSTIGKRDSASRHAAAKRAVPRSPVKSE
jgi:Transposase IS66 family